MGGWKLEAFRMAVYVSFPIALLYGTNKYTLSEDPDEVLERKRKLFPTKESTVLVLRHTRYYSYNDYLKHIAAQMGAVHHA